MKFFKYWCETTNTITVSYIHKNHIYPDALMYTLKHKYINTHTYTHSSSRGIYYPAPSQGSSLLPIMWIKGDRAWDMTVKGASHLLVLTGSLTFAEAVSFFISLSSPSWLSLVNDNIEEMNRQAMEKVERERLWCL